MVAHNNETNAAPQQLQETQKLIAAAVAEDKVESKKPFWKRWMKK
ncbi:hypothetical protein [Bacillus sp. MRMR6]|nr:hypothetical protein [Bacillus sp. MRMR6]